MLMLLEAICECTSIHTAWNSQNHPPPSAFSHTWLPTNISTSGSGFSSLVDGSFMWKCVQESYPVSWEMRICSTKAA